VERRLGELRAKSEEFAAAFATRSYLDEYKKSLLAVLMQRAEEAGHKTTAAQEREARAAKDFIDHLEAYRVSVEQSERLRWELEVAKLGIAVWQTQSANERLERKTYG
jgi:non-homologous end joining protein Ku